MIRQLHIRFVVAMLLVISFAHSQNSISLIGIKSIQSFGLDSASMVDTSTHFTDYGLKNIPTDNFYQLSPAVVYNKTIASQTVPLNYQDNPDFGFMPFGSEVENAYEEIQKRTSFERFFQDQNDPALFYFQKSSTPINFLKNGKWLSINPQLKKMDNLHYQAAQQPLICALDIEKQKTSMDDGNNLFQFNHFSMTEYDINGNPASYSANWQNHTVGNDGIYVTSIFPGIDMIIKFSEHVIKSNFILHHSLPTISRIVFTDSLDLPHGYTIVENSGTYKNQGFDGELSINDTYGNSQYVYGRITMSDLTHNKLGTNGYYSISGNSVQLNIYSDAFNNAALVYPLTIDPLVTYGPFNAAANTIGAGLSPAFCSNALVVSVPGGATCTGVSVSASVTNTNNTCGCGGPQNCNRSKDQLYLTSSCGGASPVGAPATIWSCPGAGCNSLGTWIPTFGYAASGTASMATCITPSCSAQNITFTLFLNQWGCGGATCGSCVYVSNTCAHLNSWSVTIQAHSLELLGNVAGSGTLSLTGSCNVNSTLDPAALYGVPAYTYSWSPGGSTGATLIVNESSNNTYTYIATVTDLCGVVQTATFTYLITDCPLPIELLNFDAAASGNFVDIKWSTGTEINNDYFTVERTTDGANYSVVGTIQSLAPGGNSSSLLSYSLTDTKVKAGTYYYRLKQTDLNGQYEYSTIVSVNVGNDNELFVVTPNPTKNTVDIYYEVFDDVPSMLYLLDAEGNLVHQDEITNLKGKRKHTIAINKFSNGMYFLKLTTSQKTYSVKLIKE